MTPPPTPPAADLAQGPSDRTLPSIEGAGLRPYLTAPSSINVTPDVVHPAAPTRGRVSYPDCRKNSGNTNLTTMQDGLSRLEYRNERKPPQGQHIDARPGTATRSPTMLASTLEHLAFDSTSESSCTTVSSDYSRQSSERGVKRRRTASTSAEPYTAPSSDPVKATRTREAPDECHKLSKKDKEQAARNGQSKLLKEIETRVQRHLGCDGMIELNQNNQKASGLKWKKDNSLAKVVLLVDRQEEKIDEQHDTIEDLAEQIRLLKQENAALRVESNKTHTARWVSERNSRL